MPNGLDMNQIIGVCVNISILALSILVSVILLWKIKFDDKNYRLLFIIYTLYWIAPMVLREYTSQMHNAMVGSGETVSSLMWVPVTVYGLIGLFWKPLNDLLSHRLKSRKNVIFISLAFQTAGTIPMIICPCFATNIIQSIAVGIGASGIAVFNLMFNEQYAKKKVFVTVSLLALPPLMGEFFSSVLQCCVTSFLPAKPDPVTPEYYQQYVDIVKYMWVVGLIVIVATLVLVFFLKEKRGLLYKDNQYKEPVSNKWDAWVIVLLILAAAITSFVKFSTSGNIAVTELEYMGGSKQPIESWRCDTNAFQGYLSVIFTIGQMAANILCGLFLVKRMNKWAIFTIASGIWIIYAIVAASVLNVYAHLALNVINGFAFGITYNLIVGIVLNKYFAKTNKITPITLYNEGLSIGIVASLFFTTFMKQDVFGWDPVTHKYLLGWDDFVLRNWIVTIAIVVTIVLMWGMFTGARIIEKKHPPHKMKLNHVRNQVDMDD